MWLLTPACDLDFSVAVDITGEASQLYNLNGASAKTWNTLRTSLISKY